MTQTVNTKADLCLDTLESQPLLKPNGIYKDVPGITEEKVPIDDEDIEIEDKKVFFSTGALNLGLQSPNFCCGCYRWCR